jgi:hypothetical protein
LSSLILLSGFELSPFCEIDENDVFDYFCFRIAEFTDMFFDAFSYNGWKTDRKSRIFPHG